MATSTFVEIDVLKLLVTNGANTSRRAEDGKNILHICYNTK